MIPIFNFTTQKGNYQLSNLETLEGIFLGPWQRGTYSRNIIVGKDGRINHISIGVIGTGKTQETFDFLQQTNTGIVLGPDKVVDEFKANSLMSRMQMLYAQCFSDQNRCEIQLTPQEWFNLFTNEPWVNSSGTTSFKLTIGKLGNGNIVSFSLLRKDVIVHSALENLNVKLNNSFKRGQRWFGVFWLIQTQRDGENLFILGHELGGQYRGEYNMFGGGADPKDGNGMETGIREYCEEFGYAYGGKNCIKPTVQQIKAAPKIEVGTTIVILWNLGAVQFSRLKWDKTQDSVRKGPQPYPYKEMDQVQLVSQRQILDKLPKKKTSIVVDFHMDGKRGHVSSFTIQAIQKFVEANYL